MPINTRAPQKVTTERNVMDKLIPTTVCIIVVSLVKREITSPVRSSAKKEGGKDNKWAYTCLRISALTRSPSHVIR